MRAAACTGYWSQMGEGAASHWFGGQLPSCATCPDSLGPSIQFRKHCLTSTQQPHLLSGDQEEGGNGTKAIQKASRSSAGCQWLEHMAGPCGAHFSVWAGQGARREAGCQGAPAQVTAKPNPAAPPHSALSLSHPSSPPRPTSTSQ